MFSASTPIRRLAGLAGEPRDRAAAAEELRRRPTCEGYEPFEL
jgi:hypothetical protein